MTKRRKQGEGTLRLRKDGRWEGRIVVGYDDKGLPITKNVTAKTKTECTAKLQALKEQYERSTEKINSEMLFGEWIDFWYRTYCKHTIRVTTQEEYECQIYNHVIYSHITDTMQRQAAAKIDRQIGGRQELPLAEAEIPRGEERVRVDVNQPDFEPYKPKVRKSGTGCVTMINDHLYEGRYTPTNAYGKREAHNIYAKTREKCERKLAELIVQVKADIKAEKKRLKTISESFSLKIQ